MTNMKTEFYTCECMVGLYNKRQEPVYDIIKLAESFKKPYPTIRSKPQLKPKATSVEVKEYAKFLEQYEEDYEAFKQKSVYVRNLNTSIENEIESFIKEISGLNNIPEKSRDKVWWKAYQDGHSSGLYNVYENLCELVELFLT